MGRRDGDSCEGLCNVTPRHRSLAASSTGIQYVVALTNALASWPDLRGKGKGKGRAAEQFIRDRYGAEERKYRYHRPWTAGLLTGDA